MNVTITQIAGLLPALEALHITKRTLNESIMDDIRQAIESVTTRDGFLLPIVSMTNTADYNRFLQYMEKIIKYGIRYDHASLLDFIQIYTHVEGLHRGAGDDFDSHAGRMSALIRSSTRLAKHDDNEMSDWYKDKIKYPSEFIDERYEDSFPDKFDTKEFSYPDNEIFINTGFGYVRKDLVGDKDVERGLIPLAIPQDNINAISYRQWRYIYYRRGIHSHAAPELKMAMELFRKDLILKMPILGHHLDKVWSETEHDFIPIGEAVYTRKKKQ